MNTAAHLPFVPSILRTADGSTFSVEEGRIWDLARWMPGTADFRANPSAERLANACAALAELHRAWKPAAPTHQPCPAALRRLSVLAEWKSHRDEFTSIRDPLLRRAAAVVARLVEPAERVLRAWLAHPAIVQPCLCDVWHDHVLFSGEAVSGIVDYGAMKVDHVAVDLARLLGDLVGEDDARFARGLAAYREAGGVLDVPDAFVRLLDRTGVACGIIVWMLRFHVEKRVFSDPRAAAQRLEQLVSRGEAMPHF